MRKSSFNRYLIICTTLDTSVISNTGLNISLSSYEYLSQSNYHYTGYVIFDVCIVHQIKLKKITIGKNKTIPRKRH